MQEQPRLHPRPRKQLLRLRLQRAPAHRDGIELCAEFERQRSQLLRELLATSPRRLRFHGTGMPERQVCRGECTLIVSVLKGSRIEGGNSMRRS